METRISSAQRQRYARDGFLSPLEALNGEEVAHFRNQVDAAEPQLSAPLNGQCHLHLRWAYDLATHPGVLDAVEQILGPDILVHGSTLFCKRSGDGSYVSWHQDAHNWRLEAPRLVTAWIALTPSTPENGCLRVLPGSHEQRLPHVRRHDPDNMLKLTGLTLEGVIDEAAAHDLILEPGQMSLHHADVAHGSSRNESDLPRIGFAVRYLDAAVGQESPHHPVVLARGEDAHGHFDHLRAVPSASFDEGMAAHRAFWQARLR